MVSLKHTRKLKNVMIQVVLTIINKKNITGHALFKNYKMIIYSFVDRRLRIGMWNCF
jgi:hypothetical protein